MGVEKGLRRRVGTEDEALRRKIIKSNDNFRRNERTHTHTHTHKLKHTQQIPKHVAHISIYA